MDIEKRSTRFGAAIILFAVALRLAGLVLPSFAHTLRGAQAPQTPDFTGRGPQNVLQATQSRPVESVTVPTTQPARLPLRFTPEDLSLVQLRYASDCALRADLQQLLLQPLQWQLQAQQPTVLILHSHGTESYTLAPGESDPGWENYRSLSLHWNMVAVGDFLAQRLQEQGIGVIHDTRLHDYPSYSQAYTNSRLAMEEYLQRYPSICMVLDLHRDAALNPDGSQYATSALVDGRRSAQLMLVMGSSLGDEMRQWENNLAVALKLQVLLEKRAPGITRPTVLRAQRFNQDLCPGAMLIEVGTAGNTLQEAFLAAQILAEAIAALTQGAA